MIRCLLMRCLSAKLWKLKTFSCFWVIIVLGGMLVFAKCLDNTAVWSQIETKYDWIWAAGDGKFLSKQVTDAAASVNNFEQAPNWLKYELLGRKVVIIVSIAAHQKLSGRKSTGIWFNPGSAGSLWRKMFSKKYFSRVVVYFKFNRKFCLFSVFYNKILFLINFSCRIDALESGTLIGYVFQLVYELLIK